MKNENIKITSYDYNITGNVLSEMKNKKNKEIMNEESAILEARKRSYSNTYAETHYGNLTIANEAYGILLEKSFMSSLNKIFIESIPLDESFKNQRNKEITEYFYNTLKENVDMKVFIKKCSESSTLLKNLYEACAKKAKKITNEVVDDAKLRDMSVSDYIDTMDDEELISVDPYDIDEVTDIIKDKVTEVVKTEQENNQKDMDMVEEITNQKALGENVAYARVGVEDYTLFKSIMINCCKQSINETTKIGKDIPQYTTLTESGEIQLNMDTMLMEAVIEYTRLELFNTLKISNHSSRDMKNICTKIAYSNHTQPY